MKISVIMPTYNRAYCISESIESVLSQNIDSSILLELIIIDDCSTDNTFEIIKPYLNQNVIYHKNYTNKGGAESRNIGVSMSNGEYLSFIDSDVVWYENKLSVQINEINDSNNVVYCKYRKQSGNHWNVMPSNCKSGNIHNDLLFDNFVDTPSVLLSKEIFEKSKGFDPKLPRFQDWDLFINISKYAQFTLIDSVLYDSKTLQDSITNNSYSRIEALKIIYSKNKDTIVKNNVLYNRFILKIVNSYLLAGQKSLGFKFLKNEKFSFFYKIKYTSILLILSILPTKMYITLFGLR